MEINSKQGIKHIEIAVSDLQKSLNFWHNGHFWDMKLVY